LVFVLFVGCVEVGWFVGDVYVGFVRGFLYGVGFIVCFCVGWWGGCGLVFICVVVMLLGAYWIG